MNQFLAPLVMAFTLGAQAPPQKPATPAAEGGKAAMASPSAAPAPSRGMPMNQAESMQTGDVEPPSDKVLARLGKQTIVYGDFLKWLKPVAGPSIDMIRKSQGTRNQVIRQYLDMRVLEAKARKQKLQTTADFKQMMAVQEAQVLAKVLLDEDRRGGDGWKLKEKALNPTDAELRTYFEKHKARYATPARFTARHLFVSIKGPMSAPDQGLTEAEAKAKIIRLQGELKAGKQLEDLARIHSDDQATKANGGLYQDAAYGRFAREFEEAVRTQELGKVGEPVKTAYGYHLIEVIARTPVQDAEFDKVRDVVKSQMIPERREQLKREYLETARQEVGFHEAAEGEKAPAGSHGARKPGSQEAKATHGK